MIQPHIDTAFSKYNVVKKRSHVASLFDSFGVEWNLVVFVEQTLFLQESVERLDSLMLKHDDRCGQCASDDGNLVSPNETLDLVIGALLKRDKFQIFH